MKKLLIVLGLVAMFSLAASAKTPKPITYNFQFTDRIKWRSLLRRNVSERTTETRRPSSTDSTSTRTVAS